MSLDAASFDADTPRRETDYLDDLKQLQQLGDALAAAVEAFDHLFPLDVATDRVWTTIDRAKDAARAWLAGYDAIGRAGRYHEVVRACAGAPVSAVDDETLKWALTATESDCANDPEHVSTVRAMAAELVELRRQGDALAAAVEAGEDRGHDTARRIAREDAARAWRAQREGR